MTVHEKITESVTRTGVYDERFAIYEIALRWINYNSRMLVDYATDRLDLFTRLQDIESMRPHLLRAIQLTADAVENDPLNPDVLYRRQMCYYYSSDWGEGIDGAFNLIEASPFWAGGYNLAALSLNQGFLNLTDRNQFTQLREVARRVADWQEIIENPLHGQFNTGGDFSAGNIHLCLAIANVILGNDSIAQSYIDRAIEDPDALTWAAMLQAALFNRQGLIAEANQILNHEVMEGARESEMFQLMSKWR